VRPSSGVRNGIAGSLALVSLAGLSACGALDNLLDVELPGQIEASAAETPAKAQTLVNGGITLFNCGLTWHIVRGGLLGDELASGPQLTMADDRTNFIDYTLPSSENPNCGSHYSSIAEARWVNDHVLGLLDGWSDTEVPGRSLLIARTAAYAGYSYELLGEGFCSAAVDGGPELQSAQVISLAEARFTRAIDAATAAGNAELLNLARVGRARARLFLNRPADARADAVQVPQGYVKLAQYPATSARANENNVSTTANQLYMGIWNYTIDVLYRDVRFAGTPDPRVPVINVGRLSTYGIPLWRSTKYATNSSPIELATWEEAQLIVAEANVAAGDVSGAVGIINQLHTKVGLPPFNSTIAAEVLNQIVYERRAELFLEGQHLADFRRYPLPLLPAPGTSYYGIAGTTYGTARCYPLPNSERSNNPNTH